MRRARPTGRRAMRAEAMIQVEREARRQAGAHGRLHAPAPARLGSRAAIALTVVIAALALGAANLRARAWRKPLAVAPPRINESAIGVALRKLRLIVVNFLSHHL